MTDSKAYLITRYKIHIMSVKTQDEIKKELRVQIRKELLNFLKNLVVVSETLKAEILYKYSLTQSRLEELNITTKNWKDVDTYIEYNELIEEIKMLSIFSQSFEMTLYKYFYRLGNTFNPHA